MSRREGMNEEASAGEEDISSRLLIIRKGKADPKDNRNIKGLSPP